MVQRREFLAAGLAGISALAYRDLPLSRMDSRESRNALEEFVYDFENRIIDTPEDFNFEVAVDGETGWIPDYWQSADETYRRGAGDCEDYAILHAAALHKQDYRTNIILGKIDIEDGRDDEEDILQRSIDVNHSLTEVENEGEKYVIDILMTDRITPRENYTAELLNTAEASEVSWTPRFSYGPEKSFSFYDENW